MREMPLDRPPRPPAGALTDAVRSAILAEAHRRGLQAPAVLAFHAQADYHADVREVLADNEQRLWDADRLVRLACGSQGPLVRAPTELPADSRAGGASLRPPPPSTSRAHRHVSGAGEVPALVRRR